MLIFVIVFVDCLKRPSLYDEIMNQAQVQAHREHWALAFIAVSCPITKAVAPHLLLTPTALFTVT